MSTAAPAKAPAPASPAPAPAEGGGHGGAHVIGWALAANLLIAVLKFIVAAVTSSTAMLAEACHSLADTGNQVLLLLGMRLSGRPENEEHPFGYDGERYFWAFIAALSIFSIGGAFSIYEGVHKMLEAGHGGGGEHGGISSPLWAFVVLGGSIVLELFSFVVALREFRKDAAGRTLAQAVAEARDPTVITVLFEDTAALTGLVIALLGVTLTTLTGDALWDGLASVLVGLVLVVVAVFLGRVTKSLLIGRSVPPAERARIEAIARAARDVVKVIHIRTVHFGPDQVMCGLKLTFSPSLDMGTLEQRINELEAQLRAELPHLRRIYVEPGFDERGGARKA